MTGSMHCLAALFVLAPVAMAQDAVAPIRRTAWTPAVVEQLATLPVQEGGRVKPLSALAAHTIYSVHGRRDLKLDLDGDGSADVTLTPTEWLLDVFCEPATADRYPLFRIENVEVLDAIGIAHEGGQRFNFEYLSYQQLLTAPSGQRLPLQQLFELADRYNAKTAQERSPVEAHLVLTAERVNEYAGLRQLFSQLLAPFQLDGEVLLQLFAAEERVTDGRHVVSFADVLSKGPQLAELVRSHRDNPNDPKLGSTFRIVGVLMELAQARGGGVGLIPPTADRDAEWLRLGMLVEAALGGRASPQQLAIVRELQGVFLAAEQDAREAAFVRYRDAVVARAAERGEYGKVELESYYLAASWHYRALHWFLFAILGVAASWLLPRSKWLWRGTLALTLLPLLFLLTDVALRCIVRGRPPILNLYDTFLFIASVGVTAALVTEVVTRRRIAVSLAPIFGALLITLARMFEVEDGKDQMAPLQAVLDTNYYLATHVTSINMGYAAGMFASFLGTTWLVLQAFGCRRHDVAFHKALVRATYGVTCFGLIFAVFGTIYGGVWANDSWGRFWGWDPKENGALLICIAQVSLMHARMCGWVRDFGFCVWAALTGIVVAFSWFHVNLLGIGLHAYGFSGALKSGLMTYYEIQGGLTVVAGGFAWWQRSRVLASAAGSMAQPSSA